MGPGRCLQKAPREVGQQGRSEFGTSTRRCSELRRGKYHSFQGEGGEDVQPKAQNLVSGVRNGWVDDGAHAAAGLRRYELEIHESGYPKSRKWRPLIPGDAITVTHLPLPTSDPAPPAPQVPSRPPTCTTSSTPTGPTFGNGPRIHCATSKRLGRAAPNVVQEFVSWEYPHSCRISHSRRVPSSPAATLHYHNQPHPDTHRSLMGRDAMDVKIDSGGPGLPEVKEKRTLSVTLWRSSQNTWEQNQRAGFWSRSLLTSYNICGCDLAWVSGFC